MKKVIRINIQRVRLGVTLALIIVLLVSTGVWAAFPVVSGVSAVDITDTSATVIWTTNITSDSTVNYGTSTSLGSTMADAALVTSHSVNLTSLDPNTLYYYEVQSTSDGDTTNDNNGGSYYTFTTISPPPVISGVATQNITTSSATIVWDTDVASDSVVNYGTNTSLGSTGSDSALVTSHAVTINGLSEETLYYYEVQSTNSDNQTAIDNNGGSYFSFNTLQGLILTGWGWCPQLLNEGDIGDAVMSGGIDIQPRAEDPSVADLHFRGTLTYTLGDIVDTFDLDMYGTKAKAVFSMGQSVEGMSISVKGVWQLWDNDTQQYIACTARVTTPGGGSLITYKPYILFLRSDGNPRPPTEPSGGFVSSVWYVFDMLVVWFNAFVNSLMGTSARAIFGDALNSMAAIVRELRVLLGPLIP